jgi:endoglycosylceramidase
MRRTTTVLSAVLVGIALLAAGCSSDDDASAGGSSVPGDAAPATAARLPPSVTDLRPLSVRAGRIVDDRGRDVLLRGANVNALGEYYRADPAVSPTAPVTDGDWDAMAAHGMSVVRLIMSWSRLEPERGRVDRRYLGTVRNTVRAANRRGLYVVLDMHQDAWGTTIATPDGVTCPAGTQAAIGWDGAPGWATITGGASTCRPGGRESAPAVQAAFSSFYADADGIRDELVKVWGAVAAAFAGTDGVAGYDLFNEANVVSSAPDGAAGYNRFVADAIAAVRAAETKAGARPTPVFVEPPVLFPLPGSRLDPSVVSDPDLVFAPHNYAESIGPKILTVEQTFAVDRAGADELGAPGSPAALWVGEYGFWNTEPATLDVARRYAAEEDARAVGGAWWQWRQTCGDPHSVGEPGGRATEDQVHLLTRTCPGDTDAGPTDAFLQILGRPYPRAAPGRITELHSDPATGALAVRATGAVPGTAAPLVVWLPGTATKPTTTDGLTEVRLTEVPGGRILTATPTAADYALAVG